MALSNQLNAAATSQERAASAMLQQPSELPLPEKSLESFFTFLLDIGLWQVR